MFTLALTVSVISNENGQKCAIKEVKVVSDDQSSKESLKQLNQEITLLSQLSHQNIVQYYGSDLNEERLSVYLEYVSGGSILPSTNYSKNTGHVPNLLYKITPVRSSPVWLTCMDATRCTETSKEQTF